MAFRGKRGLVLNTTRPMTVKGQSLAKGTRVKFMAPVEGKKDQLKVKVQDKRYPKVRGEHTIVSFSAVTKVERGRPAQVEGKAKPAARKASAKPAAKKTARKPASKPTTAPASTGAVPATE